MNTVGSIIGVLKSFSKNLKASAEKVVYRQDSVLIKELIAHSPVDSGMYASRWRAGRVRFGSGNVLAALRITNDTPGYGQFIETGAPLASAPWYFPHVEKKTGTMRRDKKTGRMLPWSGSGKLQISGGRVWPGGLKPGHTKTIGGAISIVMAKKGLLDKITIDVSDELVKGLS